MPLPGLRDWVFASKTFLAAMLALYIAMSLGLERPYWAMASAYIASQPLSGATRSKAVFRLCGTFGGAVAAVLLVPALADRPEVLSVALALWVAGCLYLSLLDRTPRSYACMLAGYTAAIIGFPAVSAPDGIFDTALTRTEEIALGVTLASVVASVVFPRPVGAALINRIDAWLDHARLWAADAFAGRDTVSREARRLSADGVEINLLASHLSYDIDGWETPLFGKLRARMIMLIPVLASIADRVHALGVAMPGTAGALAADVADWVGAGPGQPAEVLLARIDGMEADVARQSDWNALLLTSLLMRMRELILILTDCATLRDQMTGSGPPPDHALRFAPEAAAAQSWHRDYGMALLSSFACATAVLFCCVAWIATAWNDGYVAAEMVAVACSFFAAQDDPVPSIMQFLTWSVVGVVVDAVLLFGVLPVTSDFVTLTLALAPPLIIGGVMVAMPVTANSGRAFTANAATFLALQNTYTADFPSYVNSSLAFMLGLGLAAIATRLIRSVGAGVSVHRLLRVIWLELAVAAEKRGREDRAVYAGLMLDRLGLIGARLAEADPEVMPAGALTDIRVGLNIIDLRRARHGVSPAVRGALDVMLDRLAESYRARARRDQGTEVGLLQTIDQALTMVENARDEPGRADALLGLVGIRRGLFPDAPPEAGFA
jgi:uncharacterized membrane protein YccC